MDSKKILSSEAITNEMAEFLNTHINGSLNSIVSRPTASGMTTSFRMKIEEGINSVGNSTLEGRFRCCLCPAEDGKSVCTPCKFIKQYTDKRGWVYFVRGGLGENQYKAFYRKSDKKVGGEHAYLNTPWQDSFDKAQMDLGELAIKKGWVAVLQGGGE